MLWSIARKSRSGACTACALAVGLLLLAGASALAVDEPIKAATDRLEQIRAELDRIEAAAARPDQRPRALLEYREQAEPLREELREIIAKVEPIHAQTESRLKQLGVPPAAGQPPEALSVASEREQQTAMLRNSDVALRQARLLAVRGDQIAEAIDKRRRDIFTDRLFDRGQSFFVPTLWLQVAAAIPAEWQSLRTLIAHWYDHIAGRVGVPNLAFALVAAFAVGVAILMIGVVVRRRIGTPADPGSEVPLLPQSHKAVLATRDALLDAVTATAISVAVYEIFSAFDLFPGVIHSLAISLVIAIVLFSAGRALARAVLSPHNLRRRLPALDDDAARSLYRLIVNASIVTAIALLLNELHRGLSTSVVLTGATNAIYAALIALFIAIALLARRNSTESDDGGMPSWIRLSGWIAATVIFVALAAGYIRFASLIAERVVAAAIVLVALKLLLALVDALFGEGLKRDSPRRRAFAATLGLRVKTLDLFAALFAGLLRALFVLAAIIIVVGTLTASTVNFSSALDPSALSIQLGHTRIHLSDVLGAVVVLLIGLVVTRILYRWLSREVLPRTELEASLQNSISTIAGYIGVIVAISLGLARLGVNLENIALIAGALSIGIGFGLQSIVSNFVSGLILLTERPIRVGDWIVAHGEEGYVRKISVRSTEIETFDRASVILPNSDLITGVVKNWTHADKLGRLVVPIGVSYNSDPDQVRDILLSAVRDNPLVLKSPEPFVLFMGFGDSALEFELRGVIEDVNRRLSTMSDLRFDILRRFRAANIEIPFPQRDIHIRSAPGTEAEKSPADER